MRLRLHPEAAIEITATAEWYDGESAGLGVVFLEALDREPLPPFLVAFHNNGAGDHECFDTRYPDERGEYPIVFWDHEMSVAENLADLEPLASSFAEWLMAEVEQATELDE